MLPTKANTSPLGSGSEFKGEGESRFTEEGRDKERERPPVSDRALKPQRAWPSMSATQTGDWGGGVDKPKHTFQKWTRRERYPHDGRLIRNGCGPKSTRTRLSPRCKTCAVGIRESRESHLALPRFGATFGATNLVTTRWSTTPSSKVNLPHAINFRALCGANLVT